MKAAIVAVSAADNVPTVPFTTKPFGDKLVKVPVRLPVAPAGIVRVLADAILHKPPVNPLLAVTLKVPRPVATAERS